MTADRCPCGDVIYANTEDWEVPVCCECYVGMTEKLLPCPFCGSSKYDWDYKEGWSDPWILSCNCCSCRTGNWSDKDTCIHYWNTRHHPSCRDCTFDDGTYCAVLEIKTPVRFVEVDYSDFYCAKFIRRDDE